MKLSRLYSNRPDLFEPVTFNQGLSAVFAEIRIPENQQLDTHNLGKTTVGQLIDFCLLKQKDANFFLFKHEELFASFVFHLEISLPDGSYVTVRRAVVPGSKIDLIQTPETIPDAGQLANDAWDHRGLAFERARTLLDGILAINVLKPWGFRKLVGYLIRSQQDYLDVFQLGKFSGKHQEWKPFVAHLLGAQSGAVADLYAKRSELEKIGTDLATLTREWGADEVDPSLLDGLISVKRRDVHEKEDALDRFNFRDEDQKAIVELVDQIDYQIVALNDEHYALRQLLQRIESSLEEKRIDFRPNDAERLFGEAGVVFPEQVKQSFEQLIDFNRAITKERHDALIAQQSEAEATIAAIENELASLNEKRAESLRFLRRTDSLAKYKDLSRDLSRLRAELATLENKRAAASRLIELRRERRAISQAFNDLQTTVEDELEALSQDEESRFGRIRRYYADIVSAVIGERAIIAMTVNNQGGVDFRAELVGESGTATSGDRGTSYRKLLCIAFDLAMLRAYLNEPFPRFVYHDGALEQLEPRKRANLLSVFREYADLGIQPTISLLNSDLPAPLGDHARSLTDDDVILTLHDEGDSGRLFKMPAW